MGRITAADIAQSAGISRRTYFNHYPDGLPGVLADDLAELLRPVAERLAARPAHEQPLVAAERVVAHGLPAELIDWLNRFGPQLLSRSGAYLHGQVWMRQTRWLAQVLREQAGTDTDPLFATSFAGTLVSLFDAAHRSASAEGARRLEPGTLEQLLLIAIQHCRQGWRFPGEPTADRLSFPCSR